MAVIDLWYRKKRGSDGKRQLTERGKRDQHNPNAKRWRVVYTKADGKRGTEHFHHQSEARRFEARCRAGVAEQVSEEHAGRQLTFEQYAERWWRSRQTGWSAQSRRRIPRDLRLHIYPLLGDLAVPRIGETEVLEWLNAQVLAGKAKSSIKMYFGLLKTVFNASVRDGKRKDNPCRGIKLSKLLRGVTSGPEWVPTDEQVAALFAVVPDRYHAVLWLGAGAALRLGEALGLEDDGRCLSRLDDGELHVVQQLQHSKAEHGGFFLASPKAGSAGTIEPDPEVIRQLVRHMRRYPPVKVELPDITGDEPERRVVALLFADDDGRIINDRRWSEMWAVWRKAAGWPEHGTFHDLRHYCATTMLSKGADVRDVQRLLRHASPQTTLNSYWHWLPKPKRERGIVGSLIKTAIKTWRLRRSRGQP